MGLLDPNGLVSLMHVHKQEMGSHGLGLAEQILNFLSDNKDSLKKQQGKLRSLRIWLTHDNRCVSLHCRTLRAPDMEKGDEYEA